MKCRVLLPRELDSHLLDVWNGFRKGNRIYSSPFYAPQFTLAVGEERSDARVAVIERDGQPIGFFPFHMTAGRVGKPIGGHINDYQGPILAPGQSVLTQDLLRAAGLSAYDYNHLPTAFADLAGKAVSFSISPQMDLSQGYEAYEARKDSGWTKARREMRRRWRKTEAEVGPLRYDFHNPSEDVYLRHVELKNALYERLGVGSVLELGWAGRVLDRLRATQDPDFAAVFSTLHAGDRLVAAHFGIRSATVWHWWFPSYDLELYKLGPGINLLHQCALVAEEKGIETIDFGRGNGDFKLLFADGHVDLCEGSMKRIGTGAAALRGVAERAVRVAGRLPLGRYESYPRRAVARVLSGVTLPERHG